MRELLSLLLYLFVPKNCVSQTRHGMISTNDSAHIICIWFSTYVEHHWFNLFVLFCLTRQYLQPVLAGVPWSWCSRTIMNSPCVFWCRASYEYANDEATSRHFGSDALPVSFGAVLASVCFSICERNKTSTCVCHTHPADVCAKAFCLYSLYQRVLGRPEL